MFVRWQSRKRRSSYFGFSRDSDGNPIEDWNWSAVLVESHRLDGKPRQKHIAYLGSITDSGIAISHQRGDFWLHLHEKLDQLGNRITPDERVKIEKKITQKVPPLTDAEKKSSNEARKKYGLASAF